MPLIGHSGADAGRCASLGREGAAYHPFSYTGHANLVTRLSADLRAVERAHFLTARRTEFGVEYHGHDVASPKRLASVLLDHLSDGVHEL